MQDIQQFPAAYAALRYSYAEATEWALATLDDVTSRAKPAKYRVARLTDIADSMVLMCTNHLLQYPEVRKRHRLLERLTLAYGARLHEAVGQLPWYCGIYVEDDPGGADRRFVVVYIGSLPDSTPLLGVVPFGVVLRCASDVPVTIQWLHRAEKETHEQTS